MAEQITIIFKEVASVWMAYSVAHKDFGELV